MFQRKLNVDKGKNRYYSVSKKLKKEKKINEEFETILSSLTLEEIIALRLELSTRLTAHRLYGLPIWYNITDIVRNAVLLFAYSATRTKREAATFIGVDYANFKKYIRDYKIDEYFRDKDKKET